MWKEHRDTIRTNYSKKITESFIMTMITCIIMLLGEEKSSVRQSSRSEIFIPYILAIIFNSSNLQLMKFSARSCIMPRMCSRCRYDDDSYAASEN